MPHQEDSVSCGIYTYKAIRHAISCSSQKITQLDFQSELDCLFSSCRFDTSQVLESRHYLAERIRVVATTQKNKIKVGENKTLASILNRKEFRSQNRSSSSSSSLLQNQQQMNIDDVHDPAKNPSAYNLRNKRVEDSYINYSISSAQVNSNDDSLKRSDVDSNSDDVDSSEDDSDSRNSSEIGSQIESSYNEDEDCSDEGSDSEEEDSGSD
jgi:hypothetical protein